MPIHRKLLEILRCPVTKQPLSMLSPQKVEALNAAIDKQKVHYSDGTLVEEQLEEALITDNGKLIYRIDSEIPVMLQDRSIRISEFEES